MINSVWLRRPLIRVLPTCLLLAAGSCARQDDGSDPSTRPAPATTPTLAMDYPALDDASVFFEQVTREAGISFVHTSGRSGRKYYLETVGSGAAFLDYDDDGLMDLYVVNGADLPGHVSASVPRNALYRNLSDGTFTELGKQQGVADERYGMGVTAGDYDNDGDTDLFVTNFGPNRLYQNEGPTSGWSFTDVAGRSMLADDDSWSTGCTFADYDRDGDLDLYVANYLHYDFEDEPLNAQGTLITARGHFGPVEYPGRRDFLYRNDGGDRFVDVTEGAGLMSLECRELGAVFFDFDDDGDPDLFQGNDATPNFLYRNDGDGHFSEIGLVAGVAYNQAGKPEGTMGVDTADIDGDGRLDLVMTNFQWETNTLYRNLGNGRFRDATRESQIGASSIARLAFGINFLDADNDGDQDLYIANGHINEDVELFDSAATYGQADQFYLNDGTGLFSEITDRTGPYFEQEKMVGRGSAVADYDNDGDQDLFIVNTAQPAVLLRNATANGNHWLALRLRGSLSNRDGYGARVEVHSGDRVQVAEHRSASSYLSQDDPRLFFGLGRKDRVDGVSIRWPSGAYQQLGPLAASQVVEVHEPSSFDTLAQPFGQAPVTSEVEPHAVGDLATAWEKAPLQLPASIRVAPDIVVDVDRLQALVQADPDNPEVHLQLAQGLQERGRYSEVEGHYREALALDPKHARTLTGLGAFLYTQGARAQAIALLRRAIDVAQDMAEPHYLLGNIALSDEQYARAIAHYETAIIVDPRHDLAYYNLAGSHARRGEWRPAIAVLERGLRALPASVELRMQLAYAAAVRGDHDHAVETLRDVVALDPQRSDAYVMMAKALRETERAEEAIDVLETGLQIDPDDGDLQAQYGVLLLAQGGPAADQALPHLEKAIHLSPDGPLAYYALGHALVNRDQTARGQLLLRFFKYLQENADELLKYKTAIAVNPSNSEALYDLGAVYSRMGRYAAAQQAYLACLEIRPDHVDALNNLGNVYLRWHQIHKAVEAYTKALDSDSTYTRAYYNLANAYLMSGDGARAQPLFEQAVSFDSTYGAPRLALAQLYRKAGRTTDAENQMRIYRNLSASGGTEAAKGR